MAVNIKYTNISLQIKFAICNLELQKGLQVCFTEESKTKS